MGKSWDKLGIPQGWQFSGGFSKPGIGERETPWPSFSAGDPVHGTANPTCAVCGGRLRGKKKCSCEQPHDHWKPLGKPKKGTQTQLTCQTCGCAIGGEPPCTCEIPDLPVKVDVRIAQVRGMQAWHEGWLRECLRVLRPGGVIKAFAATRTMHRLAAAMENVGFVLDPDDSLEAWCYGSGFPKSLNVSKALAEGYPELVERYSGYGTALKPSWEPFVVGRKPE